MNLTFFPSGRTDQHGALIICPGGGYWRYAETSSEPIAEWLNSIGISAYLLRYSLKPLQHPAPLDDLRTALRTVRETAATNHIDSHKVGVIGFSAGGHLAASGATLFDNDTRPDVLVLCYPVISLREHTHEGTVINLLGENPDEHLLEQLSAHKQVTPATPPTFIWHTVEDPVVPVENTLMFAEALRKNSVPFELHLFPKADHSIGLATDYPNVAQWTTLAEVWLKGQWF